MEFLSNVKKYKKYHKIKFKTSARFDKLKFGFFGLRLLEHKRISVDNLLLILKILKRYLKSHDKNIHIRFRIFPNFTVTRKPKDIRMGRGKGNVISRVCYISKGSILLELVNIRDIWIAKKALFYCIIKLGVLSDIICLLDNND